MTWRNLFFSSFIFSASSEAFTLVNNQPAVQDQTYVHFESSSQKDFPGIPLASGMLPSEKDLLRSVSPDMISTAVGNPSFGSSLTISSASNNLADTLGAYIADINYDGKVPKTESDEYVVVKNGSKTPSDISGYYIYVASTGTQGATFYFPKDAPPLGPGKTVRVYTNEIHKETGGYSYGSGKAIWSNNGGLAVMKDGNGKKVCEYKYKPETAVKTSGK